MYSEKLELVSLSMLLLFYSHVVIVNTSKCAFNVAASFSFFFFGKKMLNSSQLISRAQHNNYNKNYDIVIDDNYEVKTWIKLH